MEVVWVCVEYVLVVWVCVEYVLVVCGYFKCRYGSYVEFILKCSYVGCRCGSCVGYFWCDIAIVVLGGDEIATPVPHFTRPTRHQQWATLTHTSTRHCLQHLFIDAYFQIINVETRGSFYEIFRYEWDCWNTGNRSTQGEHKFWLRKYWLTEEELNYCGITQVER